MKFLTLINIRSVVLAFVPILGVYQVTSGVKLDFFLLTLIFFLSLKKKSFNREIAIFFMTILLVSLISYAFSIHQIQSIFINNSLQIFGYAILLSFYVNVKVNRLFIKTLFFLGIISTLFVFFQTVFFHLFSKPITLFLPIDMGFDTSLKKYPIDWGRPNSFFLEPAHYAIFILPILYYSLLTKKYFLSILFFLGILLSTSTTGFTVAFFLVLYNAIKENKSIIFILFFIIISICIIFYFNEIILTIIDKNISKLDSDALNENIRVFGLFSMINLLDGLSVFFGLGHNQLSSYMFLKNIEVSNYSNSFLMSYFSFGIFGLFSFLLLLQVFFKANKNKIYFVILLFILLSDQILFNQNFFYLVSCIYFMGNNNKYYFNKSRVTEI